MLRSETSFGTVSLKVKLKGIADCPHIRSAMLKF